MDYIKSAVLGLVEGITEFIPVSSTGHLIVTGNLLKFQGDRASTFEIFIQLGAILAVCAIYRKSLIQMVCFKGEERFFDIRGVLLLSITTFPALFFGALAHKTIKQVLFNPTCVALALGIGGIAIILAEKFLPQTKKLGLDSLTRKDALLIGLFQCLALWPGMSRSGCTIVTALLLGIDRKTAVEYSFLASIPVIFAATIYDLYKSRGFLSFSDIPLFSVGFIVAFFSAWLAVKYFLKLIQSRNLTPFGWYRILVAPVIFFFKF